MQLIRAAHFIKRYKVTTCIYNPTTHQLTKAPNRFKFGF